MRIIRILTSVAISLFIAAAASHPSSASQRTPPGSFLCNVISSPNELVKIIETNPVVAKRYARHFKVSIPELISYFNNLKLLTLNKPGTYQMYYINRHGKSVMRKARLAAGERIFAVGNTPVLAYRCGNPISKSLPKQVVKKTVKKSSVAFKKEQSLPNGETVFDNNPELVSKLIQQDPLLTLQTEVTEPVTPEPVWKVAAAPQVELPVARNLGKWILPAIVGGGAIISDANSNTPSAVPEPSGLLALSVFIIPMLFIMKRKSRSPV